MAATATTPAFRERPILFSGPMVRAILDGKKTQTRRVIKPQPTSALPDMRGTLMHHVRRSLWRSGKPTVDLCRYGRPGEVLWVRETFMHGGSLAPAYARRYRADDSVIPGLGDFEGELWVPSIHMPRWASRLLLGVTDVRVERIQEISESDIEAEGAPYAYALDGGAPKGGCAAIRADKIGRSFLHGIWAERWDLINAKRGFGWDANPWVWAITFRRLS